MVWPPDSPCARLITAVLSADPDLPTAHNLLLCLLALFFPLWINTLTFFILKPLPFLGCVLNHCQVVSLHRFVPGFFSFSLPLPPWFLLFHTWHGSCIDFINPPPFLPLLSEETKGGMNPVSLYVCLNMCSNLFSTLSPSFRSCWPFCASDCFPFHSISLHHYCPFLISCTTSYLPWPCFLSPPLHHFALLPSPDLHRHIFSCLALSFLFIPLSIPCL